MFQIATSWRLLTLPRSILSHREITLRGYSNEEQVIIPAEFASRPPLSVDRIASRYCPTRRDLFLEVKARKRGRITWGRIAGNVIEKYCSGILERYEGLYKSDTQTYVSIRDSISEYINEFKIVHRKQFQQLRERSSSEEEHLHFILLLKYAALYELAMLGADLTLDGASAVNIDITNPILHPKATHIGIGSPSTPDFVLPGHKVIGDVKTGKEFRDFHRLTCAGYALAYESTYGTGNDIDHGIIYFFETHHKDFTAARIYAFSIDDRLRMEFLDRRNEAYQIVARDLSDPPDFANRDEHCIHCKFLDECDAAR